MWIEKLKEVFEKFRGYKDSSTNPYFSELKNVLDDWIDYFIKERSKYVKEADSDMSNLEKSIIEIEGWDSNELNDFKLFLNHRIVMWLNDSPPYQIAKQTAPKKREWAPEYRPYKECKGIDGFYKVAILLFDRTVTVFKYRLKRNKEIMEENKIKKQDYVQRLKELFDFYRKNKSNDLINARIQRELYKFVRRGLWQTKGAQEVPLMEQDWFSKDKDMQEEFEVFFISEIYLWLSDKSPFKITDLEKELKVKSYKSITDPKELTGVMLKILSHLIYGFKSRHPSAAEIAERLKEKFYIIEPISTVGKAGSWQSIEAYFAARRQELRLITKIEGRKDLIRKQKKVDEIADNSASRRQSEIMEYVQKHSYRNTWVWMLKNPGSPLWYLLSVINPEDFEIFFLEFLNVKFETPTAEDIVETTLIDEIVTVQKHHPNLTFQKITDLINEQGDIFIEWHKVRNLLAKYHKKQKELCKVTGEDEIPFVPEIEISNKILRFAQRFYRKKNKIQLLRKGIRKQKETKEFTDLPEPPASFFANEDFTKDNE